MERLDLSKKLLDLKFERKALDFMSYIDINVTKVQNKK